MAPVSMSTIAAAIIERAAGQRALVLVDGTGGSGKSTIAEKLADTLPDSAVVPVDDVSWHLHAINWSAEMLDGVIRPWLAGNDVDYRPPGWIAQAEPVR